MYWAGSCEVCADGWWGFGDWDNGFLFAGIVIGNWV